MYIQIKTFNALMTLATYRIVLRNFLKPSEPHFRRISELQAYAYEWSRDREVFL